MLHCGRCATKSDGGHVLRPVPNTGANTVTLGHESLFLAMTKQSLGIPHSMSFSDSTISTAQLQDLILVPKGLAGPYLGH